ncbi:MAG: tetratricopeptide repeat protein [Gammaproteobacteria bacterium]|nr:tetratricopeptide repeat protein [Gammaproteobacteria bacterium]
MRTFLKLFLNIVTGLLIGAVSSSPLVAKEKVEEVEYLALSALLVKGGDFNKADDALSKVVISKLSNTPKKPDLARFYTIKGIIKLRLQDYAAARDSYLKAQLNGQQDKKIFVYLAQAYYGLNDFDNALQSLMEAGDSWADNPKVWLLKALSHWAKKDFNNTMQTLLDAEQQFPDDKQFVQRRVFLLIELGLYQEAVQVGLLSLDSGDVEVVDYQTIGKAMIEAGQYTLALPVLEKAVLNYPDDVKLLRTLSRTYVLLNQFYSAATILEKAAAQDVSLKGEVAELYRKANKSEQALYFNQIVVDQHKKYKQRLAIYLDAGRFDDAIGMRDTLFRVGLLNDGNIRYALAYAYFSVGKYSQAESYLDGIQQADLFRKATQLRKAMLSCEKTPAQC